MSEPVALEVVICDLADALGAERLPGKVLAGVPTRGRAWETLPGSLGGGRPFGPLRPWVAVESVIAQRRQLVDQLEESVPFLLASIFGTKG